MSETTMNQVHEVDEPLVKLPKGKRLFYISILYVMFLVDLFIRYGVNAILPLIQQDLGVSATQLGLLSSALFLGMAVFVFPFSFLGENKSQRRTISLCAVLWSGATVVCGMASNAVTLIISRFIVGAGNSAYAPLSTAMLTSWFKKSSWGKALGFYNTAMVIGAAGGALIFGHLASAFGWRLAFYIIGGVSLVLSVLSLFLPDNKKLMAEQGTEEGKSEAKEIAQIKLNVKDTAKLVLHNKALLAMSLAAGFGAFIANIVSTFQSIYYVNILGVTVAVASTIIAAAMPLNIIATPLGGVALDRWYKKDRRARMWLPMITMALCAIFRAIGYGVVSVPIILIAVACYTFGNTSFHTACHELVPVWYKSVSYGTYVFVIQLMGALGPTVGGIIIDSIGVQQGLMLAQGLMIIPVLLLAYAGKVYIHYYDAARKEEEARGIGVEVVQEG